VDLSTLVSWAEEGRVTADSWVFTSATGVWQKAKKVPGLKRLFTSGDTTRLRTSVPRVESEALRRIRVLSGLADHQLSAFAARGEIEEVPAGATVVTKGQTEDSLYFILEGEVSVSLSVMGKEVLLATLCAGDFFGDIALLTQGGRSADVTAKSNCTLMKLSAAALEEISRQHADIAAHFLRSLDQALTERIRADNQRFAEMMAAARQTQGTPEGGQSERAEPGS